MVKQTYEFIADRLKAMQLFEKVFPYVELIDTAQGSYPGAYMGEGNYQPIDLSAYAGVGYLRKTEPIRFEKSEQETFVGCEILDIATLPIRAVVSVKKERIDCDHIFGAEFLIEELFRTLSGRYPALAECAGVNDAEILVRKTESDRLIILEQEYAGAKFKELPYDWIMITADIDVLLTFNKACLKKFCEGYGETPAFECPPPSSPIAKLFCSSFIKILTTANVYEYEDDRLLNVNEFGVVSLDGQGLSHSFYTIAGNKITLSDSEEAIDRDGMEIIIQVK